MVFEDLFNYQTPVFIAVLVPVILEKNVEKSEENVDSEKVKKNFTV